MRCGLFGKLPAKRDFVAVAAPRAFLRLVEPWLERGLAESRRRLPPEHWDAAFAAAPTWRFWLAAELCHRPILGTLVPSTDACGRLFPLILFGVAEVGEEVGPPDLDPHGEWFGRAEALLAASRDPRCSVAAIPQALETLATLHDQTALGRAETWCADDAALRQRFAGLVAKRHSAGLASRTFWWTHAPDMPEPVIHIEAEMPDPITSARMLTPRDVPQAVPAIGMTS